MDKIKCLEKVICNECNEQIRRRAFKIEDKTYCYECLVENHSYKVPVEIEHEVEPEAEVNPAPSL